MAKLTSRKVMLELQARELGLQVRTYSPGDGVTRYRFIKSKGRQSYFQNDGIYTALGISEAETFLSGYRRRR
jgi:hypothetical protein